MSCDIKSDRISAQTRLKGPNADESAHAILKANLPNEQYNAYCEHINSGDDTTIFKVQRKGKLGVEIRALNGYYFEDPEEPNKVCLVLSPSLPCIYVILKNDRYTNLPGIEGTIIYDYVNKEVYMNEVYIGEAFVPSKMILYSF